MRKKNYLWSMLAIIMVAMLGVGFASCSSDDDDTDGGSGGPGSVAVGGKKLSVPYGYWTRSGHMMSLVFYSFDLDGKVPSTFNFIGIDYEADPSQTEIESAIIPNDKLHIQLFQNVNLHNETIAWDGVNSNVSSTGSPLYITREGDKITITIENVTLNHNDEAGINYENDASKVISFTYSGSLKPLPENAPIG